MDRQLIYISDSRPDGKRIALEPIYDRSRHNNAIDNISGLLVSDGYRFVQVLEGSDEAVSATMDRISADPRHHRIRILKDEPVLAREFGDWAMADRWQGESAAEFDERLRRLLAAAGPETQAAFARLLERAAA